MKNNILWRTQEISKLNAKSFLFCLLVVVVLHFVWCIHMTALQIILCLARCFPYRHRGRTSRTYPTECNISNVCLRMRSDVTQTILTKIIISFKLFKLISRKFKWNYIDQTRKQIQSANIFLYLCRSHQSTVCCFICLCSIIMQMYITNKPYTHR